MNNLISLFSQTFSKLVAISKVWHQGDFPQDSLCRDALAKEMHFAIDANVCPISLPFTQPKGPASAKLIRVNLLETQGQEIIKQGLIL